MSAQKVLDSFAVIAFLEDEPGGAKVAELVKQAKDRDHPLLLSVVNWGEVYYNAVRTGGREVGERMIRILETLPIEIVDADRPLAKMAAELKATRKMAYADCFAAALAKARKASLVTGDKEFKEVEGEVDVIWI
ncbi:MAG: type II toxin-antitoxin system VapC family toxin [Patescibacteria group bacterium]